MSAASISARPVNHAARVVYFATGSPQEVATDLERLQLRANGTRLRVVAPARSAAEVATTAHVTRQEIIPFRMLTAPLVWLRLMLFLGLLQRSEVICLTAQERFPFLKLLAMSLRGRVLFRMTDGTSVPLDPIALMRLWLRRRWDAQEERVQGYPIGVVGSASVASLQKIVAAVRVLYPSAPVHGLLTAADAEAAAPLFDSVRALRPGLWGGLCEGWRLMRVKGAYQRWIVPCTGEGHAALKVLAFVWPINRRQIYNEFGDGFPARRLKAFWRHLLWRSRGNRQARRVAKVLADARRPIGVVGSASGYYLEKIVRVVREGYPQIEIHGLLLSSATARTKALFDSVEIFEPGFWSTLRQAFRMASVRNSYQGWVIPCTNEPYRFLKCVSFFWPMNCRQIYNELADGFPVRNLRMLWLHFRWRRRDRMSYQILAGTSGLSLPMRIVHRALYALRILGALPLLWLTRLRALRNGWSGWRVSPARTRRLKGIGWHEERSNQSGISAPGTIPAPRFPDESGGSIGTK